MVHQIIENKAIQLWANARNRAEFERYRRLISGKLKSVLDDKKICTALLNKTVGSLGDQERLILLHDPCDIRKKYSKELENLGKVRSLDNKIINGYKTFNTVAVNVRGKNVRLCDTSVYSNGDKHYITKEELKGYDKGDFQTPEDDQKLLRGKEIEQFLKEESSINSSKVICDQLQRTSQAFKERNPEMTICHVMDREFDGDDYFIFINKKLKDDFVIRMKISRNSNEAVIQEDTHKKKRIKLKEVNLKHRESFSISKLEE